MAAVSWSRRASVFPAEGCYGHKSNNLLTAEFIGISRDILEFTGRICDDASCKRVFPVLTKKKETQICMKDK